MLILYLHPCGAGHVCRINNLKGDGTVFKVKYYDTVDPQNFELEFERETEALIWINEEMDTWYDLLCTMYPDSDIIWLCGDTTEIYIPGTSISVCCELINETVI